MSGAINPVHLALRLAANERMMKAGYYRPSKAPTIQRNHVDGPVLTSLDGQSIWLSPWERLLTSLGIWDAWDIEWRHFPLPEVRWRGTRRCRQCQIRMNAAYRHKTKNAHLSRERGE